MRNPLLAEYANDPWMMEPEKVQSWLLDLADKPTSEALAVLEINYTLPMQINGDKAVIPISGILLKTVPGRIRFWYGSGVTGYDDITRMVEMALGDPNVKRIELRITSPGGQVAGGMEAAVAIRAADAVKPVTAVVEDLCASGAYWLATSARTIEANANAEVGSIGVYMVYYDWSKFESDIGVVPVVIRSGPHKGMGIDAITEEQVAAMQEIIDGMNDHFIDQVATGRRVEKEKAAEWATGRVWLAPAALKLGLIDRITAAEPVAPEKENAMKNETERPAEAVEANMPETTTLPVAAHVGQQVQESESDRVAAITAAFGKTDATFALEAINKGWSVTEAKANRHDRLEAASALADEGTAPVVFNESADGDGSVDFMAEAKRVSREQKITMTEAMKQVKEDNPACYETFRARELTRPVRVKGGKAAGGRVTL